jgi:transposase
VHQDMEEWLKIRQRVLVEGISKRAIQRETGMAWKTLEKILSHGGPPGYQLSEPRPRPKIGPYLDRIREILEEDKKAPKKQRHTAKMILNRLRKEGYTGGYTQVKKAVRELAVRSREVFVPLVHRPGEAQVDFGFALVKMAGELRQVVFFVMVLPHSDGFFVAAFEHLCLEVFWEGHGRSFEFFGGVPWRITYDNERMLVAEIIGAHGRRLTAGFLQLQSHYLFAEHFCRVARANEKGVVEGTVKYVRQNFFVPVPEVRDFEELNARLAEQCVEDLERRLRGQHATKGELLAEDRAAFLPLPAVPFEACRRHPTMANSESLVRFEGNDYSVPVRCGHHPVVVKCYADHVDIICENKPVATHKRLWGKEGVSYDPVHYLPLLERKPGALDHARPLADWHLPACFGELRQRLETERNGAGTREYIRVLRLLEVHSQAALTHAVEQGLRQGALTRDAIALFLLPAEGPPAERFRLDGRDHLRGIRVAQTDLTGYGNLLTEGGAR